MSLGTLGEVLGSCDDRMELPFPDTCDSGRRTREGEGGREEKREEREGGGGQAE